MVVTCSKNQVPWKGRAALSAGPLICCESSTTEIVNVNAPAGNHPNLINYMVHSLEYNMAFTLQMLRSETFGSASLMTLKHIREYVQRFFHNVLSFVCDRISKSSSLERQ